MRTVSFFVLILFAAGAGANECKFSATRDLHIDASGLHSAAFTLGSSDMKIHGVAGLQKIEVHGKVCASEQERLAGVGVDQHRDGDRVTVTPHQADGQSFGLFGSSYAYIDLDVRVPADLAVRIDTHSGDVTAADLAALDFSSHSGDLILHHVAGDVRVSVHSGDVRADDLGSLTLTGSGSGDVHANRVHGPVEVGHVGSGDLGFDDVSGGVHLGSVGSGDVSIRDAGGNVVVDSIGSGDIDVAGVTGDFIVKSAGSGDIYHRNVKGRVEVPRDHRDD